MMSKLIISSLFVGLGGAFGSILRYWIYLISIRVIPISIFPLGTFLVNVTGCFLIGYLGTYSQKLLIPPETRLVLIVGILGGFTTFSTFSFEWLTMFQSLKLEKSIIYALLTIFSCLSAAWLGYYLSYCQLSHS